MEGSSHQQPLIGAQTQVASITRNLEQRAGKATSLPFGTTNSWSCAVMTLDITHHLDHRFLQSLEDFISQSILTSSYCNRRTYGNSNKKTHIFHHTVPTHRKILFTKEFIMSHKLTEVENALAWLRDSLHLTKVDPFRCKNHPWMVFPIWHTKTLNSFQVVASRASKT